MMLASDSHSLYMKQALALAEQAAAVGEVPVGALVVKDSQVVSSAFNLRERDQDPTAHAELIALRQAAEVLGSWRLEGCWVYVTLEPCAMCAGAMVLSRIQGCVYGATDPRGGFLGTLGNLADRPELNHRFEVVAGVMAEEAGDLLRSFFKKARSKRSDP
jgi:tRNA(adenine34) deaminase